ncbi:MAG: NUDIX domain-containing protein [Saprospiraceae bacterium]|nr:NUDIX domain-containing protein [Saprospiraceae bacterium]
MMVDIKVRLILIDNGKILLLKQTNRNGGSYTLIGGSVENNEFAVEGLIRETYEESNIILKPDGLELVHVLHKKKAFSSRIILYFKTINWEGSPYAREKKKFKDVDWFELTELPKDLSLTARHVLDMYKQGIKYSEFQEKKLKSRSVKSKKTEGTDSN